MHLGDEGGEGRHRQRSRRWPRWLMLTAAVLVLLIGSGIGYVEYRYHQIHRVDVAGLAPVGADQPAADGASTEPSAPKTPDAAGGSSAAPLGGPPETFLLIGDNCRNCLDGTQPGQFGTAAQVAGGRSDVTMLLRVFPATSKVSIMSIPRDLWLPIPGTDQEIRVDAALNSGPSTLVQTISEDLGIPINHYVELNFDTFQDAVNAIGGIDMYFPERMFDSYSVLNMPAGCYHLNGTQALQVVRSRHLFYEVDGQWHYDGMGDISRIQRDHEFLRVLAAAVLAKGLSNPITDNNLVSGLAKDLTIDTGLGLGDMVDLARVFSHVDIAASPQTTLPVDIDNSPDGFIYRGANYGDVVFPAAAADRPVIDAFLGQISAAHPAPRLPVTVMNGTGTPGAADTAAAALRLLGYQIAGTGDVTPASDPAETVVYYASGHEAQAQSLADDLGGAVALGQNATLAHNGLYLLVGSNLTVRRPTTNPSPSKAAPAAGHTSAPAVPQATPIGGITDPNPTYPTYDPTACPPGATAQAPPSMPIPKNLPPT